MTTHLDVNSEDPNNIPSSVTTADLDVPVDIPVKKVLLGAKKGLFNGQSVVVIGIDAAGEIGVWGSAGKAVDVLALIEQGHAYLKNALTQ